MSNSNHVLITGGLGFIGSNVAKGFLKSGYKVTVYDNLDPHSGGNKRNIDEFSSDIEIVYGDILGFGQLLEAVAGKEIIINCAASTSHPFSMREPWLDLNINSRGTINILEAIKRVNIDARLIHLGTTTQIGKLKYSPADETHPENPIDIYSANKMVAEKYVIIYSNAHSLRSSVIRLPNIYGPRAAIHSPEFTFNNYFLGLALQGKSITIYGKGKQMRNLLYVDDAVDAILSICQNNETIGQTFIASHHNHYTIEEVAKIICECSGSGNVVNIDWPKGMKPISIGDAIFSNSKIRNYTKWKPTTSLKEGLTKAIDYYRPRLDWYI